MINRLRDNAEARTKQYPSALYLGARGPVLKVLGQGFNAGGELLDRVREGGAGLGRQRHLFAGAEIVELVGEQKGGEQQLPRFVHPADGGAGLAGFLVDDPRQAPKLILLAVAAGDVIAAAAYIYRYFGHVSPCGLLTSASAGQPVESLDRVLGAGAEPFVPAHQLGHLGIGTGGDAIRRSLDPGQRLIEPPNCLGEPLICHAVLASMVNHPCKRGSVRGG